MLFVCFALPPTCYHDRCTRFLLIPYRSTFNLIIISTAVVITSSSSSSSSSTTIEISTHFHDSLDAPMVGLIGNNIFAGPYQCCGYFQFDSCFLRYVHFRFVYAAYSIKTLSFNDHINKLFITENHFNSRIGPRRSVPLHIHPFRCDRVSNENYCDKIVGCLAERKSTETKSHSESFNVSQLPKSRLHKIIEPECIIIHLWSLQKLPKIFTVTRER